MPLPHKKFTYEVKPTEPTLVVPEMHLCTIYVQPEGCERRIYQIRKFHFEAQAIAWGQDGVQQLTEMHATAEGG